MQMAVLQPHCRAPGSTVPKAHHWQTLRVAFQVPWCSPGYSLKEGLRKWPLTTAVLQRWSLVAKEDRRAHGVASRSSNADDVQCNGTRQAACGERCIPVAWLCSGERECPDGTDEQCGTCCSRRGHGCARVPCAATPLANTVGSRGLHPLWQCPAILGVLCCSGSE